PLLPLNGHGFPIAATSLHVGTTVAILPRSYHSHQSPLVAAVERLTTTVSTKGQVILPKAIRQRRHWEPGTRLLVEDTPEGVLLKAAPVFAPTRPEDVAGSA